MPKIKKPTDLIIAENAMKLIWALYLIHKKNEKTSVYKIAKSINLDTNLIYDYIKRWGNAGLVILDEDKEKIYCILNPAVFDMDKDSVSFTVNGIKIRLESSKDTVKLSKHN